MSPEKLKKVEEIYHAVLELSPDERKTFLREACSGDTELRREVESLVSFDNIPDSFIDTPPESFAAEMFAENKANKNPDSDLTGRKINQYKILSVLGIGGMGIVYLANDTKLERKVAVKLLSGGVADDATKLQRFFQEAKAASALNHPNILTVHEIGEFDAAHFIVTEFIKGRTLKHYLTDENPTMAQILEIAVQIASALAAAHEAGIVHRDIKPDNIMVRGDGIVKVLDFGIAKLTDVNNSVEIDPEAKTQVKMTITTPGMIIGTPQYMSPEQARGLRVDLRTDIFSFGVLLYEMIAGKLPFSGETNMDILGSILKENPAPLSEFQPEISRDLEHLVEKTLRKDREQRYQNIKDLMIDLNDARKTLEFKTIPINRTIIANAPTTVQTTQSIASAPRFSFIHIAGLLLLLSTVLGGIYWFSAAKTANLQKNNDLKTVEVANWSSSPGEVYSVGSFSPDAKMVAFSSTRSGAKNIWVKQTATGEAVQITKDEFDNKNPIWSPNGEEIAFYSTKGNQAGIWRIPVLGGSSVFVADISDGGAHLKFWSKQNLIYYESKDEIYAIDAANRQITKVTDFAARNLKPRLPALAPDEKQIAFVTVEDKDWNLWLTDAKNTLPKKLFSTTNEIKNVVWHQDSRRIFFSSAIDGTFQIFVTDVNGATPQQMTFSESDNLVLDAASDGGKILYGSAREESDVWCVNLKYAKEFSVAAGIDSELWADVSPGGKTIAYQSIKNISQGNKIFNGNILTKNLDEKDKENVFVTNASLPKWSPNGKTLAFMRYSNDKFQLEIINADGGELKPLTKDGVSLPSYSVLPYNRIQENDFAWSPDSQKIAYISDISGQSNLWLINADGSNDLQLTENDSNLSFQCPLWSPDGKRLAFSSKTNNQDGKPTYNISVVDPETKKIDPILSETTFIRLAGWSQDGKELILASAEKGQNNALPIEVSLIKLNVETRKMSEIVKLKDTYLYNIHLSTDRKNIVFAAHRDGKDNLWLMPANGGEARQITANNDSRLYFSSLSWSPDGNNIFFGKQSRYSLLSMLTNFK